MTAVCVVDRMMSVQVGVSVSWQLSVVGGTVSWQLCGGQYDVSMGGYTSVVTAVCGGWNSVMTSVWWAVWCQYGWVYQCRDSCLWWVEQCHDKCVVGSMMSVWVGRPVSWQLSVRWVSWQQCVGVGMRRESVWQCDYVTVIGVWWDCGIFGPVLSMMAVCEWVRCWNMLSHYCCLCLFHCHT